MHIARAAGISAHRKVTLANNKVQHRGKKQPRIAKEVAIRTFIESGDQISAAMLGLNAFKQLSRSAPAAGHSKECLRRPPCCCEVLVWFLSYVPFGLKTIETETGDFEAVQRN